MRTISKLLLVSSIGFLVFFNAHLTFFETETKKLITLDGVDHILHHIMLLKVLVGTIFVTLSTACVLECVPPKNTNLCKCGKQKYPSYEEFCIDCKISKI